MIFRKRLSEDEVEGLVRDIFEEATGLKYLTDDVLDAAYEVYSFTESQSLVKQVRSDYVIVEENEKSWRDMLVLISNLEPIINEFGYDSEFGLGEASRVLNISNVIVKKWLDEAVEVGIATKITEEGELKYKFLRGGVENALAQIEMEVMGYKSKLTGKQALETLLKDIKENVSEEMRNSTPQVDVAEEGEVSLLEDKFKNIVENIVKEIDRISPSIDIMSSDFLDALRSTRPDIDNSLAFEILNCLRLKRLSDARIIQITEDDIDKCEKTLEALRGKQE